MVRSAELCLCVCLTSISFLFFHFVSLSFAHDTHTHTHTLIRLYLSCRGLWIGVHVMCFPGVRSSSTSCFADLYRITPNHNVLPPWTLGVLTPHHTCTMRMPACTLICFFERRECGYHLSVCLSLLAQSANDTVLLFIWLITKKLMQLKLKYQQN